MFLCRWCQLPLASSPYDPCTACAQAHDIATWAAIGAASGGASNKEIAQVVRDTLAEDLCKRGITVAATEKRK